MKYNILIILLALNYCSAQKKVNSFYFTDTLVTIGSIRVIPSPDFNYGYSLEDSGKVYVDSLAFFLNNNKNLIVEIGYFTDGRGDSVYSKELSQKRSENIKKRLIEKNINERQIVAVGYGNKNLMIPVEKIIKIKDIVEREKLYAKNQHIEIKIIDKKL